MIHNNPLQYVTSGLRCDFWGLSRKYPYVAYVAVVDITYVPSPPSYHTPHMKVNTPIEHIGNISQKYTGMWNPTEGRSLAYREISGRHISHGIYTLHSTLRKDAPLHIRKDAPWPIHSVVSTEGRSLTYISERTLLGLSGNIKKIYQKGRSFAYIPHGRTLLCIFQKHTGNMPQKYTGWYWQTHRNVL